MPLLLPYYVYETNVTCFTETILWLLESSKKNFFILYVCVVDDIIGGRFVYLTRHSEYITKLGYHKNFCELWLAQEKEIRKALITSRK